MSQEAQYFIEKANHCTRLARLIQDPVIKVELQTLAHEFMAEAHCLADPARETALPFAEVRERRPTKTSRSV